MIKKTVKMDFTDRGKNLIKKTEIFFFGIKIIYSEVKMTGAPLNAINNEPKYEITF